MGSQQWYAVHTKPRAEVQAKNALSQKGIVVYLPMVRVVRVNPRTRPVAPLFPSYLFVQADLEQVGQAAINWVPGVLSLVSFGGNPAAVPDPVVEHIRRRLTEIEERVGQGKAPFRQGDHVRITAGSLHELDAVFDRPLTSSGRARVLIQFLGRLAAAEVDLDALEKLARHQ
jgi:transcriptional antiterminator RfaH